MVQIFLVHHITPQPYCYEGEETDNHKISFFSTRALADAYVREQGGDIEVVEIDTGTYTFSTRSWIY